MVPSSAKLIPADTTMMYFHAASMLSRPRSKPTRNVLTSVVASIAIQYAPTLFITAPVSIVSANPANKA